MQNHNLVKEVLISEEEINKKTKELAAEVSTFYQNNEQPVVLVGVLKGCFNFMCNFMTNLEIDCVLDFMYVESYAGKTESNFQPKIKVDILTDIKDRDILIVEDIIDSGVTLKKIVEHLNKKQPKSIKIVTLLDKKIKRKVDVEASWFGFEVPDAFLVGYGLDYQEMLRNIPYVAIADVDKIKELEKNKV